MHGRVYTWTRDRSREIGGFIKEDSVPLLHLDPSNPQRLTGRYVIVRDAGVVKEVDSDRFERLVAIGDAVSDSNGNFLFKPYNGGESVDTVLTRDDPRRERFVEASRFGEVNAYYHIDLIASYIDELFHELRQPSIPRVTVVVNAHQTIKNPGWTLTGGHYRLPSWTYDIPETDPISIDGEIHLGSTSRLLKRGGLVDFARGPYRKNSSHLADIVYHEYGHHINRHTADFQANRLRPANLQSNRKIAMDEGTCDYWTAVMLGTPHIWAWHKRHDLRRVHPRSLTSSKTMTDYEYGRHGNPHHNGTIWAAALWRVREHVALGEPDGGRRVDLLVLKALSLIGKTGVDLEKPNRIGKTRRSFSIGLSALLEADRALFRCRYERVIRETFWERGIQPIKQSSPLIANEDGATPTRRF